MASFTRSDSISPFFRKFSIRAAFVDPELCQAILRPRIVCVGPRMERKTFGRNGSVDSVKRSCLRGVVGLKGGGLRLELV